MISELSTGFTSWRGSGVRLRVWDYWTENDWSVKDGTPYRPRVSAASHSRVCLGGHLRRACMRKGVSQVR